MKKLLVMISMLFLLIIGGYMIFFEKDTFLNLPIISVDEVEDKISGLNKTEENITYRLRFEGVEPVYDITNDQYFISVGEDIKGNFLDDESLEIYWIDDLQFDEIKESIASNLEFRVLLIDDAQYYIGKIKITTLPIIHLNTPTTPEQWGWEKYDGEVTVIDPDSHESGRYGYDTYFMEYKYRGANSQYYPKKSYTVDLKDEVGENYDAQLLGLRNDDDWALTALYSDTTKVRETIIMDLLSQVRKEGEALYLHPQDTEFCELFINNEYIGIYQLTEPLDEKQADLDKENDLYYKFIGGEMPTADQILSTENYENLYNISSIEIKNFDFTLAEQKWDPIIEFLDLFSFNEATQKEVTLDEVSSLMNLQNIIDNDIFIYIFGLFDNDPKNMFVSAIQQNEKTYRYEYILYDLNYSFGDEYINDEDMAFTQSVDSTYRKDPYMSSILINDPEYCELFIERYNELRETVLSEENIILTINKHMERLHESGAYYRDYEKWEMELDLQNEYDRMVMFALERIEYLDQYVIDLSMEK